MKKFWNYYTFISATTEVFNEPQDKTQFRYLHHADFPVKNGLYSYYVGTEDEKVGKFEFEVKDYDDFLNIMAYGDMGLENAQTFDLVNEAIGLLDADILLHIGIFQRTYIWTIHPYWKISGEWGGPYYWKTPPTKIYEWRHVTDVTDENSI